MRVSRETRIVAALCAVDLLSTLILIRHQGAQEGNVLMSFYLKQGTWAFIAAKCLMFMPALVIAEWYRRRNPQLVSMALRTVIVMYVLVYAAGVLQVNRTVTAAELGWDQNLPGTAPPRALPPPGRLVHPSAGTRHPPASRVSVTSSPDPWGRSWRRERSARARH